MELLKQTVNIEDFTELVLAATVGNGETPSLPKEAAIRYVREAAIIFCEKSGVLTRTLNVDLQCGLSQYLLETLGCDETVIRVNKASYGDFTSEPNCLRWSWGDVNFSFNDDVLNINPPPSEDVTNGLKVEVVVIPSRDCCKLDSQLYSKWLNIIVDGALAEIHLMANQPWTSNSKADYRSRRFISEIEKVKIGNKLSDSMSGPHRSSPNPMWLRRNSFRRF